MCSWAFLIYTCGVLANMSLSYSAPIISGDLIGCASFMLFGYLLIMINPSCGDKSLDESQAKYVIATGGNDVNTRP